MIRKRMTKSATPSRIHELQPKNDRVPSSSSSTALVFRSASAPTSKYCSKPLLVFSAYLNAYTRCAVAR